MATDLCDYSATIPNVVFLRFSCLYVLTVVYLVDPNESATKNDVHKMTLAATHESNIALYSVTLWNSER